MKGWDPEGRLGPKIPLPDMVVIRDAPIDKIVSEPTSEQRGPAEQPPPVAAVEEPAYQQEAFQDPYEGQA